MADLLGRALAFPFVISAGKPVVLDPIETISQGLHKLLSTDVGSQFFDPTYGSRLGELLFQPNDPVLLALLRTFIIDAISKWEKRVVLREITFDPTETSIICEIEYSISPRTDSLSLVYPFYLDAI